MPRLSWEAKGMRFFETGTDRGVLFVESDQGIPWPGLVSVSENPNGGEPRPFYIDGFKYLNISAAEEFEATISAFSSPKDFDVCDGSLSILNGLFVTQQPRKEFGFSYRTLIGNDLDGSDHGYKIHLVYNALAKPASRDNKTVSDSFDVPTLSWGITTRPPLTNRHKPTAHFVIDSRYTPPRLMSSIEDILYGTEDQDSRLPAIDELLDMFSDEGPTLYINFSSQPQPVSGGTTNAGDGGVVVKSFSTDDRFTGLNVMRVDWTTGASTPGFASRASPTFTDVVLGESWFYSIRYAIAGNSVEAALRYTGNGAPTGSRSNGIIDHGDGTKTAWMLIKNITDTGTTGTYGLGISNWGSMATGGYVIIGDVMMTPADHIVDYFDGSTPNTDRIFYSWLDVENQSPSQMKSWY